MATLDPLDALQLRVNEERPALTWSDTWKGIQRLSCSSLLYFLEKEPAYEMKAAFLGRLSQISIGLRQTHPLHLYLT
ncbi:hypothetical protein EYF80_011691 [Liparis tanakae]|uniref:Uncharacterized protein n=1 Tax=Liparis tanakae TaxID=230148 RepID=A0A4Z2IJY7_9TELE|nr:hypothetical protein EYF80_011691 [Liparis tanakae]